MKLRLFIFLVGSLFSLALGAQYSFLTQFNEFSTSKDYLNCGIGAIVTNLETGTDIFVHHPEVSMIPGSLLKLVTSGAALEILGEGYRFRTILSYTGEITENGLLVGDLVIKGGGDPTLGSQYFCPSFLSKWTNVIASKGIVQIEGDLVMDVSGYENQTVPDTWIWEDIGNYYGAGAGAFSIYDNTLKITLQSGEAGKPTRIVKTEPEIKGLSFTNFVLSSNKNSDQAYVYGSPWEGTKVIRGTIPKNKNEFTIKAALPHPELILGNALKVELQKIGIQVSGKVLIGKPTRKTTLLYTNKSVPLGDIVRILNHESVNLIAEHLVKQVAKETLGFGSTEEGLKIISGHWESKGIDTRGMFLEDGSGLSHFNAITPRQFAGILQYMYTTSPIADVFEASLAKAGEGTLYVFSKKDFPGNTLHCKSGSMTRVRCYAGYLETDSGNKLSFVFMVNNFSGKHLDVIKQIERFLIALKKEG